MIELNKCYPISWSCKWNCYIKTTFFPYILVHLARYDELDTKSTGTDPIF